MKTGQLTAIIEREGDGFVALCAELDVASQGASIDEARRNLVEAVDLFFESADESEIEDRAAWRQLSVEVAPADSGGRRRRAYQRPKTSRRLTKWKSSCA